MTNRRLVLRALRQSFLRTLIVLPVDFLGLFMVLIAYHYRNTDIKKVPRYLKPWINPEDWTGGWRGFKPGDNCVPADLRERYQGLWGFWRYHALRNGSSGLRNYDWWTLKIEPEKIGFITNGEVSGRYSDWWLRPNGYAFAGAKYWYICWQRKYVGVKMIRYFHALGKLRYMEIKFGWRLTPNDTVENEWSIRHLHGTTTTFQVIPKVGTSLDDKA
jgi:hypothetical protein